MASWSEIELAKRKMSLTEKGCGLFFANTFWKDKFIMCLYDIHKERIVLFFNQENIDNIKDIDILEDIIKKSITTP